MYVEGELDLSTSPQLAHALHEARLQARPVVLDLRAVSFIDCSGLRIILDASQDADGGLKLLTGAVVERLLLLAEVRDGLNIDVESPTAPDGCPAWQGVGETISLPRMRNLFM